MSRIFCASALACVSLVLALCPASHANAATLTVTNCNDIGVGSLRDAVARASSGDTITMQSLECSRISLSHGPVMIMQGDLTLIGRNRAITVYGRDTTQVLRHTGMGTLKIQGLSIAHGLTEGGQAQGGCIFTAGNVELRNSQVHHCVASGIGAGNLAGGGGVYAAGKASLFTSAVYNNTAKNDGNTDTSANGGGVLAKGQLTAIHSDISYNTAQGSGGGAMAHGVDVRSTNISGNSAQIAGGLTVDAEGFAPFPAATVANSTIARNHASQNVGGAWLAPGKVLVVNSTISGNSAADGEVGGLYMQGDYEVETAGMVLNSTIAFNTTISSNTDCGALGWRGDLLTIDSTIVANNSCAGRPSDIDIDPRRFPEIIGSHNLIGASTVPVPPDTISANPRLGALANNGGSTRTHALLLGSPAIDTGENVGRLTYDQRGPGFPREKGGQIDIGAFER
jgi:hypothetical protein